LGFAKLRASAAAASDAYIIHGWPDLAPWPSLTKYLPSARS
jgi:hypothetical protein